MEIHDGDGLRTTVFFKGCPLKCVWCHNPESISFEKQIARFEEKCLHCGGCKNVKIENNFSVYESVQYYNQVRDMHEKEKIEKTVSDCPSGALVLYGKEYETEELVELLMQDEPFFRNSGGGVTLSGGECLAQPEFAYSLAKRLWEKGISVYVDTCGFVNRESLEKILPFTDKFLYDIKAVDSALHKKYTGQQNQLILDNLTFLSEKGCAIEIRYPLVKGCNDGECGKIGQFLQGMKGITKVKVLQYHGFAASRYEALDMQNTLPDTETTFQDVENAVNILKSFGIQAVNGMTED